MKLMRVFEVEQFFDVSVWLDKKGYRHIGDYYMLSNSRCRFGWYELWILTTQSGFGIIKLHTNPVKLYVVDIQGEPIDKDRIVYYMETGKSLSLDTNIYETWEYRYTSLMRNYH